MGDPQRERRAADLFADALERDGAERAGFLDRECAGDAALRAEVDSLLAAHGPARNLFRNAPRLPSPLPAGDPARPADPAGTLFGPYRVLRLLAEGGMGEVLLAERTDAEFTKQVAIKRIRPGLGTREILERFRQERQLLADLEHPHIARLLDGGSTSDGLPYLVMEYVDGVPLDRWCDERALSLEERIRLFLRVCDAVHFAHRNLVVHRDLKPSNILVDGAGQPKLLDFGIAKVLAPTAGAEAADGAPRTVFRALTPRYASPEQIRGERITTSTDVYSLGVLLYELLAGRSPYRSAGAGGLERAVCEETPTRPSRAASEGEEPRRAHRLRGDLDTIVLRALAKDPERRYASAEDLAADLRRHLDGLPVSARPDTVAYRVTKFVQRNRALAAGVLAAFVLLLAALTVTVDAQRRAAAGEREARYLAYTGSLAAAEASLGAHRNGEAVAHLAAAPVELRGFEWRHLHARLDRSLLTIAAHRMGVTAIVIAPPGDRLLTASLDSTIALRDRDAAEPIRRWTFGSGVESVAMAGGIAVAGLSDGTVVRFPLDGSEAPRALGKGNRWAMVDLTRDGSRVAAGFLDGAVRVWDMAGDGHELGAWSAHPRFAIPRWDPAGDLLWTGGSDGHLRAWGGRTFRSVRDMAAHERRIYAMAISADGGRVATGSMDRTASVWEGSSGRRVAEFRGHGATVAAVAFVGDGTRVLSAGADGRTLVWAVEDGAPVGELVGHSADVSAVASAGNGRRLVTGDWGGGLKMWSSGVQEVRTCRIPGDPDRVVRATEARFDPAGRRVAVATNSNIAVIFAVSEDEEAWAFDCEAEPRCVAWTPDVRALVGDHEGTVTVLDPQARLRVGRWEAHSGALRALAVDPRGGRLYSAGADSCVRRWSLPDLAGEGAIRLPAPARSLEVSSDGQCVVAVDDAGGIHVWDAATGREIAGAQGGPPSGPVRFAPGGGQLVSCPQDAGLVRWTMAATRLTPSIAAGPSGWLAVAYSPDGTRLAVSGADGTIHLLEARTLREVSTLHGHGSRVVSLEFSPDGCALASASYDGTVRVWDAPPL